MISVLLQGEKLAEKALICGVEPVINTWALKISYFWHSFSVLLSYRDCPFYEVIFYCHDPVGLMESNLMVWHNNFGNKTSSLYDYRTF